MAGEPKDLDGIVDQTERLGVVGSPSSTGQLALDILGSAVTRKLVGELWMYPDGSQIVELSTKAKPGEAFQVAAEARAFLLSLGVDLTGEQQTKTKTALEFFTSAKQTA